MFYQRIKPLLRLPAQCVLCHQPHRQSSLLCADCIPLLPRIKAACAGCALPLPDDDATLCGACLQKPPPYLQAFASFLYQTPVQTLLHQYKYHHQLHMAPLFADLMVKQPPDYIEAADCIIPVPQHPRKLKERGFNPVVQISIKLAARLNIPCLKNHCLKIQDTPAQAGLNNKERQTNLNNSFRCKPLTNLSVLIIDDLMTTGSTLKAVTDCVLTAGATKVYCWSFARATKNVINKVKV